MPPKIRAPPSTEEKNEPTKRKLVNPGSVEPTLSPPRHLPRPKSENAMVVEQLKRAIRKKDGWQTKINDPIIRGRYIEEAVAQGAKEEAIELAIEELIFFETKETDFNFDDIVTHFAIFHVDGLIPSKLQKKLEKHLDVLADKPEKDFHPGSEDKVLDLIHPSLFPYIKGVSLTYEDIENPKPKPKPDEEEKKDSDEDDDSDDDGMSKKKKKKKPKKKPAKKSMKKFTYTNEEDVWGRPIEESKYQWLPAVYSVDEKNKVKITSYINNLEREERFEHPEIYRDCEKIFEKLLPTIEKCIFYARFSYKEVQEDAPMQTYEPPTGKREYQVITKACNYVLKPEETYEGNWHIEGMTHERIIASALYYYSSSPSIEDAGLSFRVDAGYDEYHGPGDERQWTRSADLGTIRTHQGRCIVFSNEFQHRVMWLENKSKTETATRKILCFFIVDPEHPIVSSEEVPPQQWEKTRRKLIIQLLLVAKRLKISMFPKDVVLKIVDFAKIGFTWEEALEHRKALMKERKFFVNNMNQELERHFSLCEH